MNFDKKNEYVNHTKDPYNIKRINPFKKIIKEGTLDGYHALIWSKCELPNEVVFL